MAACTAAPKAAMPATFSVPARRPSSCPPPRSSGSSPCTLLGQNQRADALGAADLVRRKRDQIGLHRSEIKRYFSQRLDRIDVQQPAGFMHDVSDFADRLKRAGLVVGQHHGDQRRPARRQAALRRWSRSTRPDAGDLDGPDRLRRETARLTAPTHARWPRPAAGGPAHPRPGASPASAPAHSPRCRRMKTPHPAAGRRRPPRRRRGHPRPAGAPAGPRHEPRTDCRPCPRRPPSPALPRGEAASSHSSRDRPGQAFPYNITYIDEWLPRACAVQDAPIALWQLGIAPSLTIAA